MAEEVSAAWIRLLSLGVVWMSVHCVGMCGPIISGFDLTQGKTSLRAQATGVLRYQAGRATVYAVAGAAAGLFGASLKAIWGPAGAALALAVGGAMLAYQFKSLVFKRKTPCDVATSPTADDVGSDLVQLTRPTKLSFGSRVRSTLMRMPAEGIGAAMAALPCMIPAWVLALAATTGSIIHGALLMIATVALTTPILLSVRLLGSFAVRVRGVARVLQGTSAVWLILVGLAAFGVIKHASVGFSLAGKSYMLMLY